MTLPTKKTASFKRCDIFRNHQILVQEPPIQYHQALCSQQFVLNLFD
jgi:hypothetical protein